MYVEDLKNTLEKDGLFRKDGGLNTAWIHNRSKNYDFSELEGDSLQEKVYLLYHPRKHCTVCGKPTPFKSWSIGYLDTCCGECKKEFDRRTLSEKARTKAYSTESAKKRKETCLERYGVDNPFKSQAVKERIEASHLERFGVKRPAQNKEVVAKMRATNEARYGGMWYSQTSQCKERRKKTKQEKLEAFERENNCLEMEKVVSQYGQGWLSLNLPTLVQGKYKFISLEYIPQIEKYFKESLENRSHAEVEVFEYCRSLLNEGMGIIRNSRRIIAMGDSSLELDIYIPEKKVAIEFNGIYWHSKYPKNYHLSKTQECERQGIRLLHIWEDLWSSKKSIYKSIIASALGIYQRKIFARKCECRELAPREYEEFLRINHIQGEVKSSLRLGLFYEGELVQVAGWGRSRFKEGEYELHRMCSLLNTQVVGGFSKLIKHANLTSFISYIDRDLYTGSGYEKVGCHLIEVTKPGYFYVNTSLRRVNRLAAQKHKLPKLLKNYDDSLSESQNMEANGFLRIYDCGNFKVEWDSQRV